MLVENVYMKFKMSVKLYFKLYKSLLQFTKTLDRFIIYTVCPLSTVKIVFLRLHEL